MPALPSVTTQQASPASGPASGPSAVAGSAWDEGSERSIAGRTMSMTFRARKTPPPPPAVSRHAGFAQGRGLPAMAAGEYGYPVIAAQGHSEESRVGAEGVGPCK